MEHSAMGISGIGRRAGRLDGHVFEALLAALGPDRRAASNRYELLRSKLIHFFRWQPCPDPESLADVCLDRLAAKITERTQIDDIERYCHGIARLVLLEELNEQRRQSLALRELEYRVAIEEPPPEGTDESIAQALRECLDELALDQQSLLGRYYAEETARRIDQRRSLAFELGISLPALRNRALRARRLLEECIDRRLQGPDRQVAGSAR
jgi:DNA-directed RNA polymerase specialized sigma24 family protein